MNTLLSHPLVPALGWALLHSLWQITLGCGVYLLARAFLSTSARYWAALALLLLSSCAFFGTLAWHYQPNGTTMTDRGQTQLEPRSLTFDDAATRSGTALSSESNVPAPLTPTQETQSEIQSKTQSETILATRPEPRALPAERPVRLSLSEKLEPILPLLSLGWFVGVLLLSLRFMIQMLAVRRLHRSADYQIASHVQQLFAAQCQRLRITSQVRLALSTRISTPVSLGTCKPLILLPLSSVTGLHPDQLEAILLHELAHIKRHDYLVNIVQTWLETLFFYHPAIWWLGREIRQLRELCCDDVVLQSQHPLLYAQALHRLEALRHHPLTLSARGGQLMQRIRRLLGQPQQATPRCLTGLLSLALVTALIVLTGFYNAVNAQAILEDIQDSIALRQVYHNAPRMLWLTAKNEFTPDNLENLNGSIIIEERQGKSIQRVSLYGQDSASLRYRYEGSHAPTLNDAEAEAWFQERFQQLFRAHLVAGEAGQRQDIFAGEPVWLSYVVPDPALNFPRYRLDVAAYTAYDAETMQALQAKLSQMLHYAQHGLLSDSELLSLMQKVIDAFVDTPLGYESFLNYLIMYLPDDHLRAQALAHYIQRAPFRHSYTAAEKWHDSRFNQYHVYLEAYALYDPYLQVDVMMALLDKASQEADIKLRYPDFISTIEDAARALEDEALRQRLLETLEQKIDQANAFYMLTLYGDWNDGDYETSKGDCSMELLELGTTFFSTLTFTGEEDARCRFVTENEEYRAEYRHDGYSESISLKIIDGQLERSHRINGLVQEDDGDAFLQHIRSLYTGAPYPYEYKQHPTRTAILADIPTARTPRNGSWDMYTPYYAEESLQLLHHAVLHATDPSIASHLQAALLATAEDSILFARVLRIIADYADEEARATLLARVIKERNIAIPTLLFEQGHADSLEHMLQHANIGSDAAKLQVLQALSDILQVYDLYSLDETITLLTIMPEKNPEEQRLWERKTVKEIFEGVSLASREAKRAAKKVWQHISPPNVGGRNPLVQIQQKGVQPWEQHHPLPTGLNLRSPSVILPNETSFPMGRQVVYIPASMLLLHPQGSDIALQIFHFDSSSSSHETLSKAPRENTRTNSRKKFLAHYADNFHLLVRDDVAKRHHIGATLSRNDISVPVWTYRDYYLDAIMADYADMAMPSYSNASDYPASYIASYNFLEPTFVCLDDGYVIASFRHEVTTKWNLPQTIDDCLSGRMTLADAPLDFSAEAVYPDFRLEAEDGQVLSPEMLEGKPYALFIIDELSLDGEPATPKRLANIRTYIQAAGVDITVYPVVMPAQGSPDDSYQIAMLRKEISEPVFADAKGNLAYKLDTRLCECLYLFDAKGFLAGRFALKWQSELDAYLSSNAQDDTALSQSLELLKSDLWDMFRLEDW